MAHILLLTMALCLYCAGDAKYCELSAVAFSLVVTDTFSLVGKQKNWASELTCMVFVIHLEGGCTFQSSCG